MSAPQGCTDDREVVESFREALKGRVGADRFRMWFTHGVEFAVASTSHHPQDGSADVRSSGDVQLNAATSTAFATQQPLSESRPASTGMPVLTVSVRGQFALDRMRKNFLSEIRGAAMQAFGSRMDVQLCLHEPAPQQVQLPLESVDDESACGDATAEQPETSAATEQQAASRRSAPASNPRQPRSTHQANSGQAFDSSRLNQADQVSSQTAKRRGSSRKSSKRRSSAKTLSSLIADSASGTRSKPPVTAKVETTSNSIGDQHAAAVDANSLKQLQLPELDSRERSQSEPSRNPVAASREDLVVESKMTSANFIPGNCNRLAHTAMVMACQAPATATPLFLCGPTGTGKTHMMAAIADQLRRRHRMRRVIHMSAEQFTNDFINSVGNSGITAFRRRYREVDALLIDDVQFLGSKKATLREMLYTVETLAGSGRPLVFSGLQSPTEIDGLSRELAGRMAAGLVCSIQPLDSATREQLLRRRVAERCQLTVPDALIEAITPMLSGDGRVISGVVNVVNTLQRMFGRSPSLDELRQYGGQLLRTSKPMTTLSVIELAVCEAFQLPPESLRGKSQTRAITGPRMLAMYLSRQLTSAAYSEISRHFGGRSHSTAISAEQNVKTWLAEGGEIGRGRAAMSAREALDRVETLLHAG